MVGIGRSRERLLRNLDRTPGLLAALDPDVVVINELSPYGVLAPFSAREARRDPTKTFPVYLLSKLGIGRITGGFLLGRGFQVEVSRPGGGSGW